MGQRKGRVIDYSGPRYAFTRSDDPFDGLDEYRKAPFLAMNSYRVKFPIQESAFEIGYSNGDLTQKVGYFFEKVDQGMRGGRTQLPRGIEDKTHFSRPDVILNGGSSNFEVKGIHHQDRTPLYDSQMARYSMLQLLNNEKFSIGFDIFRHSVEDVGRNYRSGGLKWMVMTFPQEIRSALFLPFPLVFSIWDPRREEINRSHDSRRGESYSPFNASIMNVFLAEPERAFDFLGENPSDYDTQKFRFPGRANSNGVSFKPFPVVVFKHKNRRKWIQKFKEEFEGKDLYFFERGMTDSEDIIGGDGFLPF